MAAIVKTMYKKKDMETECREQLLIKLRETDRKRAEKVIANYNKTFKKVK